METRRAKSCDTEAIQTLLADAFPKGEGEVVARLAVDLLRVDTTPETLSMVAESDGLIVGYIAFSPVVVAGNDAFRGYILAPVGVKPASQKGGIGRGLIEDGLRRLSDIGVNAVFVYGDPDYYGRFGFSADSANGYNAPYPLQYPFGWQAVVLNESNSNRSPATITCVESLSDPGLW